MTKKPKRKTTAINLSINTIILEKFKELSEDKDRSVSNYFELLAKRELESFGIIKRKKIERIDDVEF